MEEEEKVSRISKIVIRRYTNFQRERRIHDMHISSIELRKKSLSRIDISFGISTLGSSSSSPDDEDVSPVQSVDQGEKLLDKSGKLTWPEFSRNSVDFRSKA